MNKSHLEICSSPERAAGSRPSSWARAWPGRCTTSRHVHQHQIRQATGHAPLGAAFTAPILTAAAHALPRALDQVTRPAGTVVTFTAEGDGGGTWHVVLG